MTDIERRLNKMAGRTSSIEDRLSALQNYGQKSEQKTTGLVLPTADISREAEREQLENDLADINKQQRLLAARTNLARRSRGFTTEDRKAAEEDAAPLRAQADDLRHGLAGMDYEDRYQTIDRQDNFGGQFLASWDAGRLGQDEARAWYDYLSNPTEGNRAYAEAVSSARENYLLRNQNALDEDATLPLISQSFAGYLPQFIDQNIAGAKGALAGAAAGSVLPIAGTAAGAKAGFVAGRTLYGYETARGAAFKALLDAGVDEETARSASGDEALLSAILEGGDAVVDMLTLGIGKGIAALVGQPAKTAATSAGRKALSVLGKYGINVASEGAQEWVQEGVSSANAAREGAGALNLIGETAGQIGRAVSGQDPEALARMNQAGIEGMKVAAIMGGASLGGNALLNRVVSRSSSGGNIQQENVQTDNRLVLPGNEQNNTAPERLHEVLTASESGTPLFQSESTSQGADVPLRNDMPLGEPEGSPTDNSILPGGQDVNHKRQGIEIPVESRTWEDASNRRVNAFQYDHPELHPYYAEAARALQYELSYGTRGERFPVRDTEGYIIGMLGTRRNQASPIVHALDDGKLSYQDIDNALNAIINDRGQENYAAAKKMELVLDEMLSEGYTDTEGRFVEPDSAYLRARDAVNRGFSPDSTEYRMSEEEWASLLENEPTNGLELPGGQDVNIQAVSPDSSVGAAPAENRTSPVRMSLDEYLGRRGLRAPFSDFMDDKLRLPHGETARQRVARERAANQAADDYQNRRAQAIREYQAAVENGEIVAPTRTERLLRIAQGNADNESVQAARRSLERRGINWRSEGDTGPLSLTLPGRPEDVYDIYGSGAENLPENAVGANKASPWAEFVASSKEFFPEGANAARDVDVPTTDPQGRRIRRTASTAMGAKAIPDEVVGDIQNMVLRGELSYDRVSDKSSINLAIKTIQDKGYQGALEEFRNAVNKGVISKDIATLGQQLLINAANAGDSRTTAELLSLYAQMETTAGQAVQAASILRKLSPTAQLYAAQKAVDNLNKTVNKGKKKRSSGKTSSSRQNPSASENVPVEIWMQRVGENLADGLSRRVKAPKEQIKTVSQTILSDLRRFASETAPKRISITKKRTELDRIIDLFQNRSAYEEAWQAAKDTLSDTFENNPDAISAFEDWLDSSLDYGEMLTKELTGQTDIRISDELVDEFLQQTTQEGRDAVMDRIYQNVADQVPSTWKDKWNAWRYLAMLANPRTHIRNVAGNLFFQPLRIVKDRTAAAIEAGLSKAGVNIERTKSFAASPDLYKAAWNDWQNVKDVLSGNKYDDVRSEINSRRRVFRTAPLEAARTGNSWALEFEDSIFKRITYADALAGYLQANGVSAEQVRNNTVDAQLMARARDYAGQEALRATYQDRNMVSNKVVEVARALGPFGEAVLPFKRTPANILVRGLEYSPAGLAKALTADLLQVKQGEISAAQAIDHIAAGLTGSALFALGAYLFSEGLVTSGGGDDENQDRINDLTGQQNYALNLPGGGNVTLDWLAPEALPFFMGVELMDSLGQNGNTSESIMNALQSISEPMLELSMLQSLNDIIDSVSFSENKLGAMAASSVISYFTQAIPTIGGQIERSGEDTRMSTYTDKNLKLPTDVQYALGRASARIPLPYVDYQQIPYIDAWGRREDSGPLWLRTANNFLNPAYTSNSEVTPVDEEIQRLYDETGESGIVPDRPQRYITVNGERMDLSAEQYTQYAEERGQMQFSMLEGLVDSSAYQRLSDTDKAAVVSDVYSYADAVTKSHISDYEPDGWIAKVVESGADPAEYILYKHSLTDGMTLKERSAALERSGITGREKTDLLLAENPEWTEKAREYGVSDRVYVEFKVATSDVSADKDEDGKSVSGSKKKKVMDIIDGMDVSDEVKDSLYYAAGYTESTIDDAPWR